MQYRKLGNTGFEVSAIGFGAAMLGSSNLEYAVKVVRRALELGVNYFDTARGYWDSEIKLGLALKGSREEVYVSTKTGGKTRDKARQHIHESLERLQTDYLDNCHLHGLREGEDLEKRLGPGGALEALVEARDQGLVRHIGCTSHRSDTLIKALERFDFEVILVPMNIVEREPLKKLIPLCKRKGVGITIMKPVATGLLPAQLALKWLINQPISTPVPGTTTIEEAEENALIGHLDDFALTDAEEEQIDDLTTQLDHVRCRICRECEPCPVDIPIGSILGTDVVYDHYRTMGPDTFKGFPWSQERVKKHIRERQQRISAIKSCTECGECETRCPYSLPIITMLQNMVEPMNDLLTIFKGLQAS
jgi:predicted aldo/keto reductase-like oxidoreductase